MTIIYKSIEAPYMEEYGAYQCFNCRSVIGEKPSNGQTKYVDYSAKIEFECPVCGTKNCVGHQDYLKTIGDKRLMISHNHTLELNPYQIENEKSISLDKYYLNSN